MKINAACLSPLVLFCFPYIFNERENCCCAFSSIRNGGHERSYSSSFVQHRGHSTSLKAEASICIIGAGVSGISAAIAAAKDSKTNDVILLEGSKSIGGRVQSDEKDGFILDRGFFVFIEEYPFAKQLLDYESLRLSKFLPGALVKIKDSSTLERVSDPLRVPTDLITALLAPIGTLSDKISVLKLVLHVRSKSIKDLFKEPETNTLTTLKSRWNFSDDIIAKFFTPFLEGIYLAPLEEQSSRMFSFVFKMFSEGYATLPKGGIGEVSKQLASQAQNAGVDIRLGQPVTAISKSRDGYDLWCGKSKKVATAKSVIVATDGLVAKEILSTIDGLQSLKTMDNQVQRAVGCLYYSFKGKPPIQDPILILNGIGTEIGNLENPANNVCFPSVVNPSYAPEGSNLCSVTVLEKTLNLYNGRDSDLDTAVRRQLGIWFPDHKNEILNDWVLLNTYKIFNAQPSQLNGPSPASVHQGYKSNTFLGMNLPKGIFVCGDHTATATLNGALESGFLAGKDASSFVNQ